MSWGGTYDWPDVYLDVDVPIDELPYMIDIPHNAAPWPYGFDWLVRHLGCIPAADGTYDRQRPRGPMMVPIEFLTIGYIGKTAGVEPPWYLFVYVNFTGDKVA